MKFLKETDLIGILASSILEGLRGVADKDLNTAEELAISELDPLRGKFDIVGELAKTGSNRNGLLVRIQVHITAYYLYNRVVDDEIPQRIIDNYKKEIATIEKIAAGKMSSTLDPLTDDSGNVETLFRWGSNKKRTHELYP